VKRIVQPELLDQLPPDDPAARRSRRDLRRVNRLMRNDAIVAEALLGAGVGRIDHITELGAGDGTFLLRVAERISEIAPEPQLVLLDRQNNISETTLAAFQRIKCKPEVMVADVFEWQAGTSPVVLSNLFLHHFEGGKLRHLLLLIAERAELFVAVEPRRGHWPLFWSRLLWAIGCNFVTRHDAVVSVRAGFCETELTALWPKDGHWELAERFSPPFSHLFVARRIK
jgi:hypothetical protein